LLTKGYFDQFEDFSKVECDYLIAPNDEEDDLKINNAILEDVYKEPQQKLRKAIPFMVSEDEVRDAIDNYLKTMPLDDSGE
jgi:hypothetical protein